MPFIRAQKDLRLAAAAGLFFASFDETGRLIFFPCLRNERLPASLRPPSGFCPSFRVHAGVFFALGAIMSSHMLASYRHLKDWLLFCVVLHFSSQKKTSLQPWTQGHTLGSPSCHRPSCDHMQDAFHLSLWICLPTSHRTTWSSSSVLATHALVLLNQLAACICARPLLYSCLHNGLCSCIQTRICWFSHRPVSFLAHNASS